MIIPIDDNWRITTDERNWKLERRKENKKQSERDPKHEWRIIGYYGSLESVVAALTDAHLRLSDAHGIQEALAEARYIARKVQEALEYGGKVA